MYISGSTFQVLAALVTGIAIGYLARFARTLIDQHRGSGTMRYDMNAVDQLSDLVGSPNHTMTLDYACRVLGMLATAERDGNVILIHNPEKPEETVRQVIRADDDTGVPA